MKRINASSNVIIAYIAEIPVEPTKIPMMIANNIPANGVLTNIPNK